MRHTFVTWPTSNETRRFVLRAILPCFAPSSLSRHLVIAVIIIIVVISRAPSSGLPLLSFPTDRPRLQPLPTVARNISVGISPLGADPLLVYIVPRKIAICEWKINHRFPQRFELSNFASARGIEIILSD